MAAAKWLNKSFAVYDPRAPWDAHNKPHPAVIQTLYFVTPPDWTQMFGKGYPSPSPYKLQKFYVDGKLKSGWLVAKVIPGMSPRSAYKITGKKSLETILEEHLQIHRI